MTALFPSGRQADLGVAAANVPTTAGTAMNHPIGLSIMVWSCGLDGAARAATPFMLAQAAAALELQVEMLFTAEAIGWLLPENGDRLLGFGPQAQSARAYVQACAELGIALRACSQAMAGAGLGADRLVPQCAGFSGMVAFAERSVDPAWRTLVF